MQPLKMVDLYGQYLNLKSEIDAAIQNVINDTAFINGPIVRQFAQQLAAYLNVNYVIPCANGTDALQIALMGLDLPPDSEVIVPSHTYVATAEVAALLKLKPIFIDVDRYFTLDIAQVESLITSRTKAIIPVHLYGQCANMEPLLELATKYNIHVIEDTAQALGADYIFSNGKQRKAGTMGISGTTSFFPSKTLGAYGDGGALFTNDAALAKRYKMIANHGQQVKYLHEMVGCNSRLDSIQAAILAVKLKHLDDYNQKRQAVAKRYDEAFKNNPYLAIPQRAPYSKHVFHQYTVKVKHINRDELRSYLKKKGIPTMIYYPKPIHQQKPYAHLSNPNNKLKITEDLQFKILSLPIHTELTYEQQDYIITTIQTYLDQYA